MTTRQLTLVLCGDENARLAWRNVFGKRKSVVLVRTLRHMEAAIDVAETDALGEILRFVFDQSIEPVQFLRFVASMPSTSQLDALYIDRKGWGFLSTPSVKGVGRHLYELDMEDLAFYLMVHFDLDRSAPAAEGCRARESRPDDTNLWRASPM